jgi:hypothetical protein
MDAEVKLGRISSRVSGLTLAQVRVVNVQLDDGIV